MFLGRNILSSVTLFSAVIHINNFIQLYLEIIHEYIDIYKHCSLKIMYLLEIFLVLRLNNVGFVDEIYVFILTFNNNDTVVVNTYSLLRYVFINKDNRYKITKQFKSEA